MNHSGAPIGEKGRKELKVTEGEVDDLLTAYFADLKEEGYRIDFRVMSYMVPQRAATKTKPEGVKDTSVGFGEIQDVEAKSINVVKLPENYIKAARTNKRNDKNADKYDKARKAAKMESGKRLKSAVEKVKAEIEQNKNRRENPNQARVER